jgi:CHRD domain
MNKFRTLLTMGSITATLALTACNYAPLAPTSGPAAPGTVAMTARLSSSNEVPTNNSAGTGLLEASFNKQTNVLTWTVTYSGLTDSVKAAHFHGPAMPGTNAGVVLGFSGNLFSPIKETATLTPAQASDLMAGKWYVNLHTEAHPQGEIRGQIAAK